MAEPLKLMYSIEKLLDLSSKVKRYHRPFNEEKFIANFKTNEWKNASLKQRVRMIAMALHANLPNDYRKAIDILIPVGSQLSSGYFGVFLPDFVELYGEDDWDASMTALADFTKTSTSEFAIRRFILKDPNRAMKQMLQWSRDENMHVRRLSSEGCRPRLPWGMQLHEFMKNPKPILPILENLKNDDELYVRKSVANNLNDISKDNPDVLLEIARRWKGKTGHTDWIIAHAMRGLLKQGNKHALALFGHHDAEKFDVTALELSNKKLMLGETLRFSFLLCNRGKNPAPCRVEYAIDYMKANKKTSQKVFQISKTELPAGNTEFSRSQLFRNFTTRKHYSGKHTLHILVNGEVKASADFQLQT